MMGTSLRSLVHRLRWAPPCLVGLTAFLVVVGPRVLDPTNVAWVRNQGDTLTHYLGWAFFRHAPWTVPVGLNPNYGLELSSSILYTDSIPLLALLFKPLSPWLPELFQYTGMWLLACFVLQGLFGGLLVGLATPNPWLRLAGSALVVFAPPMLFRLAGHWALVGQWTVLAAAFLALRPERQRQTRYWAALVVVAALSHTYLFAMAAALWAGSWVGDLWPRRRHRAALAVEAVLVPGAALCALWQAGLFIVGEGKAGAGFGQYKTNLNAFFNPYGWSRLLPNLPSADALEYEGFAYLGLGTLLLVGAALPSAVRLHARGTLGCRREWLPVAGAVMVLTAVAVTNRVALGIHAVTFPLPEWIEASAGIIRASGRFVWPLHYAVLLGSVILVVRAWPTRVSLALLVAAVAVQVVDTAPGWKPLQAKFRKRAAVRSPLTSGFWFEAPSMYRRVRLVPPGNVMQNWDVIAGYAERHGLATDAIYAARIDEARARALSDETASRLTDGRFERDTFYVLQGNVARRVPCSLDPSRDQLAVVDGFLVLMPGWTARHGNRYAGQLRLECPVLAAGGPPLEVVADSNAGATLSIGWSLPEAWGTWSRGPRSVLRFRVRGRASAVEITASPFAHVGPPLTVQVSVNGQPAAQWEVADPGPRPYRVALPAAVAAAENERPVHMQFDYSQTWSPRELGQSADPRQLAFALSRIRAVDEPDPRRR